MPPDHLTTVPTPRVATPVLAVLAGADLTTTATAHNLDPADLAEAIDVYHSAGLAALERRADRAWYQIRIEFPDWSTAETAVATHLAPALDHLQESGAIAEWWFLRKHPCWRLRLHDADPTAVNHALDHLATTGTITRWRPTLYEPETTAFGGPTGIATAHDLFCADTRGVLTYFRNDPPPLGRRETSFFLLATLLTAASLDQFECGDVFTKVAHLRPLPPDTDPTRIDTLAAHLRPLLTLPNLSFTDLFIPEGKADAAAWLDSFRTAGAQFGGAAAAGRLERGLRSVLAQVVIFHWNRLGISATNQAVLARAAGGALLPGSR